MLGEKRMTKNYSDKRIEILNNGPEIEKLEVEKKFLKIIEDEIILKPVKMGYDESKEYQICISFLIDAFQQIPNNPDIALERILLAYDCYYREKKLTETYDKIVDIAESTIKSSDVLQQLFSQFCKYIPEKTQNYLASRLYRRYMEVEVEKQSDSQTKLLWTRLSKVDGNYDCDKKDLFNMLKKIGEKYKLQDNTDVKEYDGTKRKMGRLISKSLKEEIIVNDISFQLKLKDKLYLLIQGVLQTVRNDRMHGNDISPFKSSKANIGTYQHYYYCFLLAYFILLLNFEQNLKNKDYVENMVENIGYSLESVHKWGHKKA